MLLTGRNEVGLASRVQSADPGTLPWALSPAALGLDGSLTLARGENSVVSHDCILPFPFRVALTDRGSGLHVLWLRTPVAAATVRDETALEVIGSRTALAEQTARRLDDSAHRAPILLGDAIECLEGVVSE